MGPAYHPYITLAMQSVRHYLAEGTPLPCPDKLPDDMKLTSCVFVSIKKVGKLRGCIGTLTPNRENLALEIIHNAISAATKDPRFDPIDPDELDQLTLTIDVLSPLEKISDSSELDCKKFGLILKHGDKQGVLLPNLDNIETIREQIETCLKKGGIKKGEPYEMYRFEVKRFT